MKKLSVLLLLGLSLSLKAQAPYNPTQQYYKQIVKDTIYLPYSLQYTLARLILRDSNLAANSATGTIGGSGYVNYIPIYSGTNFPAWENPSTNIGAYDLLEGTRFGITGYHTGLTVSQNFTPNGFVCDTDAAYGQGFVLDPFPTRTNAGTGSNYYTARFSYNAFGNNADTIPGIEWTHRDGTSTIGGTIQFFDSMPDPTGTYTTTLWQPKSQAGTVNISLGGVSGTNVVTNAGTIYDIPYFTGVNKVGNISPSTSGYVLTSNGTGAAPTFQAASAGVTGSGTSGQLTYWNGTSSITGTTGLTLDATNKNILANNFNAGWTTTTTAAGTTTLTVASSYEQDFTGSTTQTVQMPVTSTLNNNYAYYIINYSTGTLTVNSSGGNLIISMAANSAAYVKCIGTTHTTAVDWETQYAIQSTNTPTFTTVTSGSFNSTATQTTVNNSVSGTTIFSQPLQGSSYKKVVIYINSATGTASYTFPTAFTQTPGISVVYGTGGSITVAATIVTSLSTSAVTVTGATTTGFIMIEGY